MLTKTYEDERKHFVCDDEDKDQVMKRPGLSIVSSQSGSEDVCHKLSETNCEYLEDFDDHGDHEVEENHEKAVCQTFASSISETQIIWQN